MEWTSSAKQELDQIITSLKSTLNSPEVDADEVAADILVRMKAELQALNIKVITAENVRTIATRLGVQQITKEVEPDERKVTFEKQLKKPGRIKHGFKTSFFWLFGIVLPVITLATELTTHMCRDEGFTDPIPTFLHPFLILLVPLANFASWRTITQRKSLSSKQLSLLLGAATAVSIFYTIQFITFTHVALFGLVIGFIFGVGLLALLPLSPLLSMITLLRSRVLLKRSKSASALPFYKKGLISGFILIFLFSLPLYLTQIGLNMATDDNPAAQLRGIKLLRGIGNKPYMNRACYWRGNFYVDPFTWFIERNSSLTTDKARDIYYRVTGTAFNSKPSPTMGFSNRRNPGDEFSWDSEQGGDVVAGRLKGLSLSDSRMDGLIDEDAATAYVEWTMVFKNEWHSEREARAQIALPPSAVVSRLTLWIDGEEREAAFGGRSQVKQAYKKIVKKRRDPVLVTTSGPDRILMQCYPVPTNGTMKVRIGITAPLALLSESDRALRLPYIRERNFRIPEKTDHYVWLKGGKKLSTSSNSLRLMPDGSINGQISDNNLCTIEGVIKGHSSIKTCWAKNDAQIIQQTISNTSQNPPDHIAIVIDQSASMKPYLTEIAAAMEALPSNIPITVFLAGDQTEELIRAQMVGTSDIRILQQQILSSHPAGGCDNSDALREIWNIPDTGKSTSIVWIHGPQNWSLNSGEKLRQVLERHRHIELIDFQTKNGPHRLVEKLGDLTTFRAIPIFSSIQTDLTDLLQTLSSDTSNWKSLRSVVQQAGPNAVHATDHLVRLYAWDQIREDLSDNKPGNKKALELALKHHLVTPVSGAVVLETQQQYKDANLSPVDSDNVPSVPEPTAVTLLLFAALFILYGTRIIQRLRIAWEV